MTVGIFIIATGKYISFCYNLLDKIQQHFLVGHKKIVYIFTDSEKTPEGSVKVYQEHRPFPYPTLYRYHIILQYCEENNIKHDYMYYLDADMDIVDEIGEEIFGKLTATIHPGFYMKGICHNIFDRKFLAKSYINPNKVKKYYCGGFNGGKDYLKMAKKIIEWVNIDEKYSHVPIYHDESYLNKYLALNPPDNILTPEYCMPDLKKDIIAWGLENLNPKIIAITKHKGFR